VEGSRFGGAILGFLAVLASLLGCGSGDGGSSCDALSACCAELAGSDAQACQAALDTSAVTEAECAQALDGYQSAGLCQGVGGSGAAPDGGASDAPPGSGSTACVALGACCPSVPVSGDPMGCLTVAQGGTEAACAESLSTYVSDGYCSDSTSPASPGLSCFELSGSGDTQVCAWVGDAQQDLTCASISAMLETGSCPSSDLFGCCVSTMTAGGTTETSAACYYGSLVGSSAQTSCTGDGQMWVSIAP
jgi:hypothetical protein